MRKIACLILSCLSVVACSPTSTPDTSTYNYDPRIPGGSIGVNLGVSPVTNLRATLSASGAINISWQPPTELLTMTYEIKLYRKQCTPGGSFCSEPNPKSSAAAPLYLLYSGTDNVFNDESALANFEYTYWAYVSFSGKYSSAATVSATATALSANLNNITSANFWPSARALEIARPHLSGQVLPPGANVLGASKVVESQIAGKAAYAKKGSVLYYADTENNRVVVMIKQTAIGCTEQSTDPITVQACMLQSTGEPFVPFNILGQPDRETNLSCQQHQARCEASSSNVHEVAGSNGSTTYQLVDSTNTVVETFTEKLAADRAACGNMDFCSWEGVDVGNARKCSVRRNECMTKPTHVAVDGDTLLVTDAGNNRVLLYSGLPVKNACDTHIGSDILIQRNCTSSGVIGKKSTLDLGDYSLLTDGDKALSDPGAIVAKGGNLYIADRGNKRIVRARNYSDQTYFSCTTEENQVPNGMTFGEWNSLCRFDQVLGQQTLFESKSFGEIVLGNAAQDIDVISSDGAGNLLNTNFDHLLQRYFGTPNSLFFTDTGKLVIASDQNFLLDTAQLYELQKQDPRYYNFYIRRIDKSPIALKSRILIFDTQLIEPTQPSCQPSVFDIGGCDAEAVIGQLNFKSIPVFSGNTADDYRNSISYGLTYVTDVLTFGKTMMAVDAVTRDIYVWKDWTRDVQGRPFDYRIEDPGGAAYPNNPNLAMPKLVSPTGLVFSPESDSFVVTDPGSGQVYEVKRPK
jgi:hypothetical protein